MKEMKKRVNGMSEGHVKNEQDFGRVLHLREAVLSWNHYFPVSHSTSFPFLLPNVLIFRECAVPNHPKNEKADHEICGTQN